MTIKKSPAYHDSRHRQARAAAIDLISKNGAKSQNEDENHREGEERGVCSERRADSDVSPIARLRQSVDLPTIKKIPSELGRPMAELRPRLLIQV